MQCNIFFLKQARQNLNVQNYLKVKNSHLILKFYIVHNIVLKTILAYKEKGKEDSQKCLTEAANPAVVGKVHCCQNGIRTADDTSLVEFGTCLGLASAARTSGRPGHWGQS